MGKKSDRREERTARARWRDFCDAWVAIGRAAQSRQDYLRNQEQARPVRSRALYLATSMATALMGSVPHRGR